MGTVPGYCLLRVGKSLSFLRGLDVFGPFDVAVGGVGKVTELEHQQHILSGKNVDGCLQQRTDVPGDPLLAIAQQNEHAVANAYSRYTGVQIAYDEFDSTVAICYFGKERAQ